MKEVDIETGGVVRRSNGTAANNGSRAVPAYDSAGRNLIRPIQVRDLLQTAYATTTTGAETELLAGTAGEYHDLLYVLCANESDVAITVDFRQSTGGSVQLTLEVPANSSAGVVPPAPTPQDHADSSWTVQTEGDISNTTIAVTALFSKEV